jgi:peptide-methionine (S)-S-oxide reductase
MEASMSTDRTNGHGIWGWMIGLVATAIAIAAAVSPPSARAGDKGRVLPAPVADSVPGPAATEVAVLAGGCFWGVQGIYQRVDGVAGAVSGYAGGDATSATYDVVSRGDSGHAEAVKITFDPRKVSYGTLLQIFFSVAHDPTELNRQGPDVGPQYRSAIFPTSPQQAQVAAAYIAQLNAAQAFGAPIVTTIEADRPFYPAEAHHQDYLTLHPTQPYIAIHDLPKIEELKRLFPARFRAQPALVRPPGR